MNDYKKRQLILKLRRATPTIIGVVLYFAMTSLALNWFTSIQKDLGLLAPVVLIFLIQLLINLAHQIPNYNYTRDDVL